MRSPWKQKESAVGDGGGRLDGGGTIVGDYRGGGGVASPGYRRTGMWRAVKKTGVLGGIIFPDAVFASHQILSSTKSFYVGLKKMFCEGYG